MTRNALTLVLALLAATPALAQTRAEIDTTTFSAGASVGSVEARVTAVPDATDATMKTPSIEIRENGKPVLTLTDTDALSERPFAAARFAEMDPGNDTPEVVVAAYTGGAHCCSNIQVATKTAKGWKAVKVGSFDGSGDLTEDADGDGRFEIVSVDNAFLYAFDCYACSYGPLKMFAIENGASKDVSKDPRYLDRHKSWLEEMTKNAADPEVQKSPGWIVGDFAMRIAAGDGAAAAKDFDKRTAKAKFEPVIQCPDNAAECADEARKPVPFAQAVKLFLKANGYAF